MKNGTKLLLVLVVIVVAVIMIRGRQEKKEGMSPYTCYSDVGNAKAAVLPPPFPAEPGPYGTIWVMDSLGAEIYRRTDSCLSSNSVRQYWCESSCFNKQCWAVDSNTFFSVDFNCNRGCLNGVCTNVYDHAQFISDKNVYLSGGDFAAFISNANKWVI
jgi:hypothetical protein